jgi:multiple sugar transport system permease protein
VTAIAAPRRRGRGDGRDAWLLVLPALIPVVLISVYPLLQGILLGFTDAKAGLNQPTNFTGIDNYTKLLGNDLFWSSFRIGLVWAFGVTILQFLASLGLALLLNLNLRLRWLARTLALVPWAMPPVVIAIMWRMMLNPTYGPVNGTMRSLGLPGDINWLGDFSTALPAVGVIGAWVLLGLCTLLLLAGMTKIDPALYEAARIDGASAWREFRSVTVPSLRQEIGVCVTVTVIAALASFDIVYIATQGGPGNTTMVPGLEIYYLAFSQREVGLASALAVVLMVLVLGCVLPIQWLTREES